MRGSPTPPEKVEEIKAIAVKTANIAEASRQTNVPYKTAHDIVKNDDQFAEFRYQAWKQYIFDTWGNIEKISNGLADYIDNGKLRKVQLRDLTGALKDLRQTVENVVQNINQFNIDNRKIEYNVNPKLAEKEAIEFLQELGYKIEKVSP